MHSDTVSQELLKIAQKLSASPELAHFRIVGGTAIDLQVGHRMSGDIDFFTNEKTDKRQVITALKNLFPDAEFTVTEDGIISVINGIKVELFDSWSTPFLEKPVEENGLRLASLKDLSAFKLDAIIERREKKDYIDLYFLFEKFGATNVLDRFKEYNQQVSVKSILFALEQVVEAGKNKSVMPEMLVDLPWSKVEKSMLEAAKEFIAPEKKPRRKKGPRR
jgi:hypothetical protein